MKEIALRKSIDWEQFGYGTMLSSNDEEIAKEVCGLQLSAYEHELRPQVATLRSTVETRRGNAHALHVRLYDRPVPVNDASMLTHSISERIVFGLCILVAGASFVGNFTTFLLFGFNVLIACAAAFGATALIVGIGYLAFEKVLAGHTTVQLAIVLLIAGFGVAALYQFGQARKIVIDKASAEATTQSYVDGGATDDAVDDATQGGTQATANGTLGGAAFLITMAAELALGFLGGLFVKLRTDEDYVAWRELRQVIARIRDLEERAAEVLLRIEIAKKQCMTGIRRAQDVRNRRRPPYHNALALFVVCGFLYVPSVRSQTVEHDEAIVVDTSTSIANSPGLFAQYMQSIKQLLRTEPANTRVWVLTIDRDSFGGVRELEHGWTPGTQGVFTDDLDRARRQLAVDFESKSSTLAPTAQGTDIIGALWRVKSLFESNAGASAHASKTIWIFSDMMNETREFQMPPLIDIGPERMLDRAKGDGLIVPLPRYSIRIYGASPRGLTPPTWTAAKRFWQAYFAVAGANLTTYSAECDQQRNNQ